MAINNKQNLVDRVEEIRSCVLQIPPTYDPEVSHETLRALKASICHPKTWMPSSIMFNPLIYCFTWENNYGHLSTRYQQQNNFRVNQRFFASPQDPNNPTSFGEPLVCEPRKPPEARVGHLGPLGTFGNHMSWDFG